ncbi:MAG TPA: class I SAM-dependent methyltransferase [Terriglobales bacterium]|nr:class I SAM-dependent methyltransferase [Terriglobales bacterium]
MTEWNAPGYARIASLQEVMADEVLALLALQGTERVLDLGCGNGKITAEIAARLPQGSVLGVDFSAEMIAFAAGHYARPNLRFQAADIRSLSFHAEFDLVVSFNALHWIPEQDQALRSIRAAMKSGAIARLRLVPRGERKSLEDVIEETRLSERWSRYFQNFHDPYLHLSPEEYAALAERNGLRVRSLSTEDRAWDFKSRSAFEAFGSVTFVEWAKLLPESEKPIFVTDVLDRYRQEVTGNGADANTFKFYQMDVTLLRSEQA